MKRKQNGKLLNTNYENNSTEKIQMLNNGINILTTIIAETKAQRCIESL